MKNRPNHTFGPAAGLRCTLLNKAALSLAGAAGSTAALFRMACPAAGARPLYDRTGMASAYGARHQGRKTASGEIFDENQLTAAHRALPFQTLVQVTNLKTGRLVVVRINDRGAASSRFIIDLSRHAADVIGITVAQGIGRVHMREVVRTASLAPAAPRRRYAALEPAKSKPI